MERTVTLKLIGPTHHLDAQLESFRDACNTLVSHVESGTCRPNERLLQKQFLKETRARHGLMGQVAISAMRVVAGAYKTLATQRRNDVPTFREPRLQLLYRRGWRFKNDALNISLPGVPGGLDYHAEASSPHVGMLLCATRIGAMNLVRRGPHYYAKITVILLDEPTYEPTGWYGVDAGIRTTAVARVDGESPVIFSGGALREHRKTQRRTRRRLQKKGTRSARRVQTRLCGREQRHVLDQCRVIAKHIVERARRERRGIKLEDLRHIRTGLRVPKAQRADRHAWAFRVLQTCVRLKAEDHGVPVLFVQPAYTSRTCPRCLDQRKANRKRDAFHCQRCGYQNHSDVVGATNISRRPGEPYTALGGVEVNRPHGHAMTRGRTECVAPAETASKPKQPLTLVGGR